MKLDDFTRTERGQALLETTQEARAAKRPMDPTAPVLEAVEAIAAAATSLESGNPDTPTQALATRLRRSIDYLLDVEAQARELVHEETRRRIIADVREKLGLAPGAEQEPESEQEERLADLDRWLDEFEDCVRDVERFGHPSDDQRLAEARRQVRATARPLRSAGQPEGDKTI